MPETEGSILTGFSPQRTFDLRLDTAKTLESVFNRPTTLGTQINTNPLAYANAEAKFYAPQKTTIGDPLADVPDGLTFEQALISDNPKLNNLALDILSRKASDNTSTRLGLNSTITTPYAQGEKFIDKDFGYDARSDNEDWYHENVYAPQPWYQKWTGNALKFVGRTVVGAVTKFAEGLGYLGQMTVGTAIDALTGKEIDYWGNVADNAFSKVMLEANKDFQDEIAPVYRQAGFDEKGFFSKLGDATFWNESVADGAAFLASAFIPAGIASKLGWLGKGVQGVGMFGRGSKFAIGVGKVAKFLTGGETLGEGGLALFNVANESAFEAASKYRETRDELKAARSRGENNLSDKEIQSKAGEEASTVFKWNMAALTVSNAWEMKNIIKPIMGRRSMSLGEEASKVSIKAGGKAGLSGFANSFLRRGAFYGAKAGQGTLAEGFWEENIQGAISRVSTGSYTRKGDDTGPEGVKEESGNLFTQYWRQTYDALRGNDREISESIGIGALLGVAGGVGGSKFGKRVDPVTGERKFTLGERRQMEKAAMLKVAEINNAYSNFMDINSAKNKDGTVDADKLAAKMQAWKDITEKQDILDNIKDKQLLSATETKVLENTLLNDYIKAVAQVGRLDQAIQRISDVATRPVGEKGEAFLSNPLEVASYVQKVGEEFERIQRLNIQDEIPEGFTEDQMATINQMRKDRAFDLIAEKYAIQPESEEAKKKADEDLAVYTKEILSTTPAADEIEQGLARNRAPQYTELAVRKALLEEQLAQDLPPFVRSHYKLQLDKTKEALKELDKIAGDMAPTIDIEGNLVFPDKIMNKPAFKAMLDEYRLSHTRKEIIDVLQGRNDATAEAILDPVNGLANWAMFLQDTQAEKAKAEQEKAKKKEEEKEVEKTATVKTPETEQALAGLGYTPEDIAKMTTLEAEKIVEDKEPKDTEEIRVDDEDEEAPDEDPDVEEEQDDEGGVDEPEDQGGDPGDRGGTPIERTRVSSTPYSGKVAFMSRLKTVNYQLRPINDTESILVDSDYNIEMNDFILNQLELVMDAGVYKPYVVNDKPEWQQRFYTIVKTDTGFNLVREGEIVETFPTEAEAKAFVPKYKLGQVVVLLNEKGEPLAFKSGNPAVFSFDETAFDKHLEKSISLRDAILKTNDSAAVFERERKSMAEVRRKLSSGEEERIPIGFGSVFPGVEETTPNLVPVAERFPDFDFHIITGGTEVIDGNVYKAGKPIITVGGQSFSATTQRIKDDPRLAARITALMSKQYESKEEALKVARYLKTFVYVRKDKTYFVPTKGGRILYFKNKEQATLQDLLETRVNIKVKPLTEGYEALDLVNGKLVATKRSGEEYKTFIKKQLITNRKVVWNRDKTGLFMEPVNAYFTFTVPNYVKPDVDPDFPVIDVSTLTANKEFNQKLQELIDNSQHFYISDDEKFYIDKRSGKKYSRVTGFTGKTVDKNELVESSNIVGNNLDQVARDFFAGKLKDYEDYKNPKTEKFNDTYNYFGDEETFTQYVDGLKALKAELDAQGAVVFAGGTPFTKADGTIRETGILAFDKELGVAGTLDFLIVGKDGTVRIMDLKTKRSGLDFLDTPFEEGRKTDRESWTEQLNLYRILINNTHGIKVSELEIVPVKVNYREGGRTTVEAKLLPRLKLDIVDEIVGADGRKASLKVVEPKPAVVVADVDAAMDKELFDTLASKKEKEAYEKIKDLTTVPLTGEVAKEIFNRLKNVSVILDFQNGHVSMGENSAEIATTIYGKNKEGSGRRINPRSGIATIEDGPFLPLGRPTFSKNRPKDNVGKDSKQAKYDAIVAKYEAMKDPKKKKDEKKAEKKDPVAPVQMLSKKDMQAILALKTSAEVKAAAERVKKAGITVDPSDALILTTHRNNLEAAEKAAEEAKKEGKKEPGSIIEDAIIGDPVEVKTLETWMVAGKTYTFDFSKPTDIYTGPVPSTYEETLEIFKKLKEKGWQVRPAVSANFNGERYFNAIIVIDNKGRLITFDNKFNVIPDSVARANAAIKSVYNEMRQKCNT